MTPPVLHTARLTLGPASPAHAEAFIAFCATEASRFVGGPAGCMERGGDMSVLETKRLRLVMPAARHIPAYQAFCASDRAAARGWSAMPHEAWRNFAAMMGHHQLRGFGPFVAEAREDGRVVGLVGPWWPDGQLEREIKWHIWPDADEGKGYAFEAAQAVLFNAFGVLGWRTAVSYITFDNDRSAALARRLGAVQDGTWTTPRGTEVRVFRHVKVAA